MVFFKSLGSGGAGHERPFLLWVSPSSGCWRMRCIAEGVRAWQVAVLVLLWDRMEVLAAMGRVSELGRGASVSLVELHSSAVGLQSFDSEYRSAGETPPGGRGS